ncbi:MAG: hypothetical protein HEP71_16655 [Roseivirga sp.]|nr:hypothetical protein [Roseivirga sp.]
MIIGNKQYISFEFKKTSSPQEISTINFHLGGKLISGESTYLPTYVVQIENFNQSVVDGRFSNPKLTKLTLEECFNKLVRERNSDEDQYFDHLLLLDETIDKYYIFAFQSNKSISFAWSCWDEHNCNDHHQLNQIYSVQIPTAELNSVLTQLCKELKNVLNGSRQ